MKERIGTKQMSKVKTGGAKGAGARPKARKKPTKQARKTGRPSSYSADTADRICELLASGQPLNKICAREDMPSIPTVMAWLWRDTPHKEEFLNKYTRAREQQAETYADQIISIADDDSEDAIFVEGKDGTGETAFPKANREFIQRSHLRVEARKWIASKLLPKKYGDRKEHNVNATVVHEGSEELKQIIRDMGRKYGIGSD